MNIPEAIENLEKEAQFKREEENQEMVDSILLGIEALERCELARKEVSFVGPGLLPGETED